MKVITDRAPTISAIVRLYDWYIREIHDGGPLPFELTELLEDCFRLAGIEKWISPDQERWLEKQVRDLDEGAFDKRTRY